MMRNRAERTLEDLYDPPVRILEPQLNCGCSERKYDYILVSFTGQKQETCLHGLRGLPVLKGSFHIRGPVEDSILEIRQSAPVMFPDEVGKEGRPLEKNLDQDQVILHRNILYYLGHRFGAGQVEDNSGLEYHGDNIMHIGGTRSPNAVVYDRNVNVDNKTVACSHVSSNCLANISAFPVEPGDANQNRESGEHHHNLSVSNATRTASYLDKTSNIDSANMDSLLQSQKPLFLSDLSQLTCSQSFHSQNRCLSLLKVDRKYIEGALNLQSQEETICFAELGNAVSCLTSLAAAISDHKSSAFLNCEALTASLTRSESSSGNLKMDDLCPENVTGVECEKPFVDSSKGTLTNDPFGRDGALYNITKGQAHDMQNQATIEGDNSDSDLVLDVKVCDICGDAGREDLLAICSRCNDGAEHTYCMQEMLDKLPEGEWLCEECKIKEIENKDLDETEVVSGRCNSVCLNENMQSSIQALIPKALQELHATQADWNTGLNTEESAKSIENYFSTREQAGKVEARSTSELSSISIEMNNPKKKKPFLFHQRSLNHQDMGKIKTATMSTSYGSYSPKGSKAFSRSKSYLGLSSFKDQAHLHSPCRLLSRSVSFGNKNIMQEVKSLVENVAHKQKSMWESTTNDQKKDGLAKLLPISASSKSKASGFSKTYLASKRPSNELSCIEDLRAVKDVKKRNSLESKKFSTSSNSIFGSSASVSSDYPLKLDTESFAGDQRINRISEANVHGLSKGFTVADSIGSNEGKKQISCSSKKIGPSIGISTAENRKISKLRGLGTQMTINSRDASYSKGESMSEHRVVKSPWSSHKDDRTRNSAVPPGSKLSTMGVDGVSRCRRCNEIGHVAQQCSVGKLQEPVNKHLTEGDSEELEVLKEGSKWTETVDNPIRTLRVLLGNKIDFVEELRETSADVNHEVTAKHSQNDLLRKKFSSVGNSNATKGIPRNPYVESTKKLVSTDAEQQSRHLVEVSIVPEVYGSIGFPKFSRLSVPSEISQGEAPPLANPLRSSAIPKLECIWLGCFSVLRTGNPPELFDGIQAHLSTYASPKVIDVATKVACNVQLEEVSYTSSRPLQFLRVGPQEENIAVFFFAKDAESFEGSYRKLLDRMRRNDLALKGNINGTELLVFTSNKLPLNSQRWNRMYYIWGMFRGMSRNCLSVIGNLKKPTVPNLNLELLNQDFYAPPTFAYLSNSQNLKIHPYLGKSYETTTSKTLPGELSCSIDLLHSASNIEDKARRIQKDCLVLSSLNQMVADSELPFGRLLFRANNSLGNTDQLMMITDTPEQMVKSPLSKCSNENDNKTCQKMFVSDCTDKRNVKSSAPEDGNVEFSLVRESFLPSVSPNLNQEAECSRMGGKMRGKKSLQFIVPIIDEDPRATVLEVDQLSCDSRTNRKQGWLCPIRSVSQPSGDISNNTDGMVSIDSPRWMHQDEREQKKNCNVTTRIAADDNASTLSRSKVHPLCSRISSQQQEGEFIYSESVMPEKSKAIERCFLPVNLGPVLNNRSTNIIHAPSSVEDTLECCSPELELALAEGMSTKPLASPVFSSDGGKQHHPLRDDADGVVASLSLSLGFSASDMDRSSKSIPKKEQILHDRPPFKSSFLLFGRSSDS